MDYFAEWGALDLQPHHVLQMRDDIADRYSNTAANFAHAEVRRTYEDAFHGGLLGGSNHNPAIQIRPIATPKPKRRPLSQDESNRLCALLRTAIYDEAGIEGMERVRCSAFYFICLTGCRLHEACDAMIKHFDPQQKTLTCWRDKVDRHRTQAKQLALPDQAVQLLTDIISWGWDPKWFFPGRSIEGNIKDVARYRQRAYEILEIDPNTTTHSIRHTVADIAHHGQGVPVEKVQQMLGHMDPRTTRLYLSPAKPARVRDASQATADAMHSPISPASPSRRPPSAQADDLSGLLAELRGVGA